jgi:hypothetical protein
MSVALKLLIRRMRRIVDRVRCEQAIFVRGGLPFDPAAPFPTETKFAVKG